jgi:hypothetical protein
MANARLIQEALINLLGSKKANTAAQKGVSSQLKGGMVDQVDADIADARAADLARKRAEAQRVQGTDPLAQSAIQQSEGMVPGVSGKEALGTELGMRAANRSMFEGGSEATPEGGSITDNLRRTQHLGLPGRLEAPGTPLVRSMELRGEDEAGRLNRLDVDAEIAGDRARTPLTRIETLGDFERASAEQKAIFFAELEAARAGKPNDKKLIDALTERNLIDMFESNPFDDEIPF